MDKQEYLNFALKIANYAKDVMLKYFYEENDSHYKDDKTIVTKADIEINKYLIEEVRKKYPNHSVDGEEEQFGKSEFVWICDPIDGTAMYARHIPVAVFSLALAYKGNPIVAVVLDPFTDNMYTAIEKEGAYKNNKKISVNNYDLNDKESIIHFDTWPSSEYIIEDIIKEIVKESYCVSIGSIIRAGLCVASGEFTGALFPGTKRKNYDIAAIKLIVEEAGGIVTNIKGKNQRYDKDIDGAIITNKKIYDKILNLTNNYLKVK